MAVDFQTEQDVNKLRWRGHVQQVEIKHQLRMIAKLERELAALRGTQPEVQERFDELAGAINTELRRGDAPVTPEKKARKPRSSHGPRQQPKLTETSERYVLDEADKTCPQCGGTLEEMADQAEHSEMIDVTEVSYRLVKVARQKYRCGCGACVETAPGPERGVEGGRYSLDFAVKVAHDKYEHHLPLERQRRMMKSHGLDVTSQTLWAQIWSVSRLLAPVAQAIKAHILAQPVIGLDQTGWPDLRKASNKTWQMWALTAPGAVHHQIRDDKSAATMLDLLGDYRGTIVADRLSTHDAAAAAASEDARDGPPFRMVGCWAHIRRKFADCEAAFPEARIMLDMIGELYDVDAEANDLSELAKLRATKSADILERIHGWLWSRTVPSTLALGAAVKHTVNHWPYLKAFTDDPQIWLDNNPTERAIRGPVVGRRNHFGSKSRRGREAAAILYGVIETAKLHGIDARAWMTEACRRSRLSDGRDVLLPWDFAPN